MFHRQLLRLVTNQKIRLKWVNLLFHFQLNQPSKVSLIASSGSLSSLVSHWLRILSDFLMSAHSCLTKHKHNWLEKISPVTTSSECSYLLVTAMCRFAFPSSITSNTSSGLVTNLSVAPLTNGIRFLSSWTLRLTFETVQQKRINQ